MKPFRNKEEGKYTLTAFGRIIYQVSLAAIENAVNNYWKLKAIESLKIKRPSSSRMQIDH
jgi:hypothetical protein